MAKQLVGMEPWEKEVTSFSKIEEWFTAWGGKCYVSFSGGKDSTVLAYMVAKWLSGFRTPPYSLTLVFVNTGLEYPEIQRFADEYSEWLRKRFPRIEVQLVRLRPKMNIRQVITRYGYPVVSKEVAHCVYKARASNHNRCLKRLNGELLRSNGEKSAYNCEKWGFLVYAPFAISTICCSTMKKCPAKAYECKTKNKPLVATMADEGRLRMQQWLKTGCNAFEGKRQMSKPMSFWTEQDVLRYLLEENILYCSVYGDIVASDGECDYDATLVDAQLHCTGCDRTGCIFCAFGAHLEKGETRYERLKRTHPKHYEFCIGGGAVDPIDGMWKPNEKGLGFAKVLDFVGVRY